MAKKILITGKGSYVGTSFIKWVSQWPDQFEVEELSVRGEDWKENSFSSYDTVLHVAGIVHKRAKRSDEVLYMEVNRDLAFSVAQKAKNEGVKQFVFISSMSVYGIEEGSISYSTAPKPKSYYGISKLQAEQLVQKLSNKDFIVTIIRPPMIYGKNCKGNYKSLANLAVKIPMFPDLQNQRSMIYIDNLSNLIMLLVQGNIKGVILPQNTRCVSTSEMVKLIAQENGKKIRLIKIFNPIILILMRKLTVLKKVFGNLFYEDTTQPIEYCIIDFEKSIKRTEEKVL